MSVGAKNCKKMGTIESVLKREGEARSMAMIKMLKDRYPEHNWSGTVEFDNDLKRCVFKGFTKEENEIISKVQIG